MTDSAVETQTDAQPQATEAPKQDGPATQATSKPKAKRARRPAKAKATRKAVKAKAKRGRPKGSKNKTTRKTTRKRTRAASAEMTVEQLEKQLARKQATLVKMQEKQRKTLVAQLAKVDEALAGFGVTKPKRTRKVKKARTKSKAKKAGGKRVTLGDSIAKVLGRKTKGMPVKDIRAAVVKGGYKSSSKNMSPMISQALRNKRFKKVSRGVYAVA